MKKQIFLVLLYLLGGCAASEPAKQVIPVYPPPPEKPRYIYEQSIFSSLSIAPESGMDRFKRFATGQSSRGKGFGKPFGIVARNGRVFVGDTVARRIRAFDFPGKRYYEFGDRGQGRLAKPLGMAGDAAGRIYVCDGTSKRIMVYRQDGQFLRAIGGQKLLKRPSGVAVNRDGTRIYVVDTGGVTSQDHRVRVFDDTGAHLFDIGRRGSADGEFNLPLMATVGPEGNLYVVDTGNFRVQVFSPDGQFISKFGRLGRRLGQFSHPKGIAVEDDGKVFVTDTSFGNFQIFNEEGRLLLFIGQRNERGGPGTFILPAGIAVDVDGRVYVVDQFFRKVEVFRPAGVPAGTPRGQRPGPMSAPPSKIGSVGRTGAESSGSQPK